MLRDFIVWSEDAVHSYNPSSPANTLAGLREAEELANGSLSSVISTHSIKDYAQSVVNETNISLCYAESDDNCTVDVAMFSVGDYDDYEDAMSSGGVTTMHNIHPLDIDIIKRTFHATADSYGCKDRIIGTVKNGEFTEI